MGRKKAWLGALLAVLGLAVGSQVAKGQEKPEDDGEKPVQKGKSGKPQGERGDRADKGGSEFGECAEWVRDLGLSDEQQAELREVVKATREARVALYKAQMDLAQKQREDALAILTPAQKNMLAGLALYDAVLARYRGTVLLSGKPKGGEPDLPPGPLELTDAQKERIKAICVEVAKGAPAAKEGPAVDGKGKGRAEPTDRVMRAVRDQVLTAEQRTALAASQLQQRVMGRALAALGKRNDALRISDGQLAEIRIICESAAINLQPNAGEKGDSDALQKVMEEVQGVLTAEQRDEINKRMEPRAGGKGGKGGDGGQPSGEKGQKPVSDDGGEGK